MKIINKWIIVSVLFLSTMSCNKEMPHEYLLQHPEALQAEWAACRKLTANTSHCDMVKQTLEQFSALVTVREQDPERFGKQILQMQMEWMQTREKLLQLRKAWGKKHSAKVKQQIIELKQKCQEQQQKIKVLLAVVRVTTYPESFSSD